MKWENLWRPTLSQFASCVQRNKKVKVQSVFWMLLLTVTNLKSPCSAAEKKKKWPNFPTTISRSHHLYEQFVSQTHTHKPTETVASLQPVGASSIHQIDWLQAWTKGWQLLPQTAESAAADGNSCTSPHPLISSNQTVFISYHRDKQASHEMGSERAA